MSRRPYDAQPNPYLRISLDEWWKANVPDDFWEHIEWHQILQQLAYDVAHGLVVPPAERPVYNDGVGEI